jgi:uncharacterized protein (TIGR02246 family)
LTSAPAADQKVEVVGMTVMKRGLAFIALLLALPFNAFAGPKEDGQAVFDKFLTVYTSANVDSMVGMFWPDALFWGTTMVDLSSTPDGIRAYFTPGMSTRKPGDTKGVTSGTTAIVLSDNLVMISGMWHTETVVDGKPVVNLPNRVSLVAQKRGDQWLIAQFHNSARPVPATPAPAPAR